MRCSGGFALACLLRANWKLLVIIYCNIIRLKEKQEPAFIRQDTMIDHVPRHLTKINFSQNRVIRKNPLTNFKQFGTFKNLTQTNIFLKKPSRLLSETIHIFVNNNNETAGWRSAKTEKIQWRYISLYGNYILLIDKCNITGGHVIDGRTDGQKEVNC